MTWKRQMTFKAWLREQQERNDPVGTFARAAAYVTFPDEVEDARQELARFGASEETLENCAQSIREYHLVCSPGQAASKQQL